MLRMTGNHHIKQQPLSNRHLDEELITWGSKKKKKTKKFTNAHALCLLAKKQNIKIEWNNAYVTSL
jgi:hypothetical protein